MGEDLEAIGPRDANERQVRSLRDTNRERWDVTTPINEVLANRQPQR